MYVRYFDYARAVTPLRALRPRGGSRTRPRPRLADQHVRQPILELVEKLAGFARETFGMWNHSQFRVTLWTSEEIEKILSVRHSGLSDADGISNLHGVGAA
jgi:hypothetical protein